ncbi:MAG: DNA gyrase subunit A, partial [Spirochaetales bacterium]|nr:DNA gyrase subunit A [Spirochaetales bacterium]
LPSRFPNLLVNGSSGIAVGMATNMPPHNLREVIEGIDLMIENPDVTIEELSKVIKGPDFPTGANIMGKEGIRRAYKTGRGKIRMRAVAEIEESSKGKHSIIVTEIPYQVNKSRLIEKIAEYVRDKKLEGISDLRDESDREGMRIVIEVRRDANPKVVLNNLYKYTQLQSTFGIINLALVDGQPKVLNLKQILHYYLEHQKEIITRRTKFDLAKAEARAHIVEALRIALDNIDRIIKIIRGSSDDKIAREALMSTFKFSEIQAQAILDMRLKRLTSLESDKLNEEYEALIKQINWFKEILGSEKVVLSIIKEELLEIKEKYGDMRRTRIMFSADEINMEDMIEDEDVVITLTHFGYIKRMPEGTYRPQKRGGVGVIALSKRDEDFVEDLYITSTHSTILFFTSKGRVFSLKAYEIPEGSRTAKGTAIVNLLSLNPDERVSAIIPLYKHNPEGYLVMATKDGTVKKTELSQFENIRKTGIIGISLRDEDELISVKLTNGEEDLILVTQKGMA